MIYTHDHAPAHVHAWHSGNTVIIQIEGSPAVRDIDGMRTRDIATAKAIVEENLDHFRAEWRRIHG